MELAGQMRGRHGMELRDELERGIGERTGMLAVVYDQRKVWSARKGLPGEVWGTSSGA